ncbi:hypothetical protein F5Y15DRAFT_406673 [Xylariaceae sp. FL0016]|nr:hypothetical protein F5Y15DRAFT_406673 [Xylariaceae sp. FL0016]
MATLETMANTGLTLIPESLENIRRWNNDIPPGIETPVHNLIQTQREKTPQFGAVCAWDGQFTLASSLILRGVKAETFVPVCFEKSRWTVVAVLAVLKAGGAFVLLDPSLPTGATLALSSVKSASLCKSLVKEVQQVDECSLANIETGSIHPAVDSRDAAYIMFTSGSTGVPKGVMVEHSSLSSTSVYSGQAMGYGPGCRNFQFASHAFDPIITDIFATLVHGGTICIPSDWERENDTVGAMRRLQVSHLRLTPSLFGSLDIKNIPSLSTVVLGGEVTPAHLVEEWSKKVRLILVYGPAECCVICFGSDTTTHACQPGEIGRPFSARAWVVKQGSPNELAEVGEIGELVVEGPTVARGYLRNPEKTAEVFIPNPRWLQCFPEIPCQYRFYRTGDLVRQLEDGAFVYAGRADNQVKIRGQRLELEEVEQHLRRALSRISQIETKQVVVLAVDFPGMASKHLVALLCLGYSASIGAFRWERNASERLETSDQDRRNLLEAVSLVKAEMGESLPPFAIPSLWVPLRDVPLTVSKKVDRKLLQSAVSSSSIKELSLFTKTPSITNGHHAVRNSHEIKVRELWANVFGISADMIESDDHFISLGGDSVLAIKLAGTARSSGLSLSFDTILKNPVLRDMASKAEVLPEQPESFSVSPFSLLDSAEAARQCDISDDDIEDMYPCHRFQLHYILGYPEAQRDPSTEPWHWQSQSVYRLPSSMDLARFQNAWRAVIQRHQSQRTRVTQSAEGIFQVVLKNPGFSYWTESEDLESYLEQDRSDYMTFGSPLLRLALVQPRESDERLFVLTAQHIIYDAFSRMMLFKDVETVYKTGRLPEHEPPKMNSFVKYMLEADKSAATEFWTSLLTGARTKPILTSPGKSALANIREEVATTKLPQLRASDTTLATMLEVAAGLALARHIDCSDVILYCDRSGRNLPVQGIEDLIACTTMFIPMRIHVDAQQKVRDLLTEAQRLKSLAIPHEHLGWLELREMDHLKPVLANSVNVNINPYPNALVGRGLGLEFLTSHLPCDDPFGININILDEQLIWSVYYDEEFISNDNVNAILEGLQKILYYIVEADHDDPAVLVGDVLTTTS